MPLFVWIFAGLGGANLPSDSPVVKRLMPWKYLLLFVAVFMPSEIKYFQGGMNSSYYNVDTTEEWAGDTLWCWYSCSAFQSARSLSLSLVFSSFQAVWFRQGGHGWSRAFRKVEVIMCVSESEISSIGTLGKMSPKGKAQAASFSVETLAELS